MSNITLKPVQHNTNHPTLKVEALPSGPPRYRPPPQPQSSKTQNYFYPLKDNLSAAINADEFNQFQTINDVNRYVADKLSYLLLVLLTNLMLNTLFSFDRFQPGEKPPYITSGVDLSHYPPSGGAGHLLRPDPIHTQEMLKFVRKPEIDNSRYMADQVTK